MMHGRKNTKQLRLSA